MAGRAKRSIVAEVAAGGQPAALVGNSRVIVAGRPGYSRIVTGSFSVNLTRVSAGISTFCLPVAAAAPVPAPAPTAAPIAAPLPPPAIPPISAPTPAPPAI